jgi:class 3 adenylate cyclase
MPKDLPTRLASGLYRDGADVTEDRESQRRENRAHLLVFAAILGVTLVLFFDLLSGEAARWSKAYPSVPLSAENWKLRENAPPGDCARDHLTGADCPANPANPALWRDGVSRFVTGTQLKRKAKRDFWVGATFTPEMVNKAIAAGANQFLLGWVYSDYEVYVEGRWVLHGLFQNRAATVVPISFSDLRPNTPLHVAILIHPDSEGSSADYFARPWQEGLATAEEASNYLSANVFTRSAKPFGLFLLNLLFSVMFFLFWQMQKRKQEYFYFALFGAVGALVQVKFMDIFRGALDLPATHAFDLFLYVAEGGFGFLTALSFARGRQSIFRNGIPFLLIAPWTMMLLPITTLTRSEIIHFVAAWFVPAAYVAGAAVCGLQAWYLYHSEKRHNLRSRIQQLSFFAIGMLLIGSLGVLESRHVLSLTVEAFTTRFTHFSIVLLLAVIALQEYREERQLLERSPISKYHRRPQLPELLRGALLCVDIKDSEYLFQESAATTGDSGRMVRACLSHLWGAVIAEGGSVLSTAGDGLYAFFDGDDCPNPAESALRASDRMRERLAELARQLHAQGLHHGGDLGFRAGIAVGEIKPVWQEVDRVKVAGWSDTGTGNVFVETARLMEIERQLGSSKSVSHVVLPADTAFSLRGLRALSGKWVLESKKFVGKHDRSYLVSVYSPSTQNDEESEDTICVAG